MLDARMDPSGFYNFDLTAGRVQTRAGERVVVLSDDVLSALISAAARDGNLTPLRRLGERLGDQAHHILDRPAASLSPDAIFGAASGIAALFGWGRFDFERWGDALVILVSDLPSVDEEQLGAAALLGGLFSRLSQRQVACVPVGADRFIMVDLDIAETVWNWHKSGMDVAEIVGQLQGQG